MSEEKAYTEQEAHRHFAASLNGEVWTLLGKADRSQAEDETMIHTAHASCCHWLKVGTGVHHQRAEWMIARVYSELGLGEAALRHASRCQELTEEHADLMEDFDRAYAQEALARANAVAGNQAEARKHLRLAEEAGQAIADEDSKRFFVGDLADGDWHGVK
jgi:phosphoribosylformimino-5-aminoimidazole carboxamide ribonucleotide (ProFAR) isomerase